MKKIILDWKVAESAKARVMYCFKRCDVHNN